MVLKFLTEYLLEVQQFDVIPFPMMNTHQAFHILEKTVCEFEIIREVLFDFDLNLTHDHLILCLTFVFEFDYLSDLETHCQTA